MDSICGYVFMAMCMDVFMDMYLRVCISGFVFMAMCMDVLMDMCLGMCLGLCLAMCMAIGSRFFARPGSTNIGAYLSLGPFSTINGTYSSTRPISTIFLGLTPLRGPLQPFFWVLLLHEAHLDVSSNFSDFS